MAEEQENQATEVESAGPTVEPRAPEVVASQKTNPVWRWLWQGPKAARLQHELSERTELCRSLTEQARSTRLAAQRLGDGEAEGEVTPQAIVASLCLAACRYGVLALDEARRVDPASGDDAALAGELPLHLPGLSGERLSHARETYATLVGLDLDRLWSQGVTGEQVDDLLALAGSLVRLLESPARELEGIAFSRLTRLALPIVILIVGGIVGGASMMRAALARETGFAWAASSTYHDPGCTSPSQECAETRFFFCTKEEENPWIEFDLGKSTPVSRVQIRNRTECPGCAERAVPLVVEVSADHSNWKQVARRDEKFNDWKATFPKEKARWVRLQAQKRTYLHLQQVRIGD